MKKTLLSIALLTLISTASAEKHQDAHWGYKGDTGPAHWGELSEKFALCSSGENQSPIDIKSDYDVKLPVIEFTYTAKPTKVLNNGHTIQVDISEGSSIKVAGKTFQLKQFHFHTPSENTIDGKSFPLEAHFVHRSSDTNEFAVVAVMFEEGDANPILDKIWEKMPTEARKSEKLNGDELDYTQLQPDDKDYYRFNGSFTTPPCTEGVYWHVLKKPLTASKAQIETFLKTMHHPNNRNIQEVGARVIVE